ncbi:hypothetical protein C8F01DRAFT_1361067 [Mycena amicta]|nr:hypothetical protein C8F01DRAFT_1361067 [Mycena amicta]
MSLSKKVEDAFQLLGISVDASRTDAAKAYKIAAIKLHPDKNHEEGATERFQELGAAWDIVQQHYDNPSRSYIPDVSNDIDPEDLAEFFVFVFEELIIGRFATHNDFRRYRRPTRSRSTPGAGVFFYFPSNSGPAPAALRSSGSFDDEQAKHNAAYKKRLEEFERQIEEEERELKRLEREKVRSAKELTEAYQQAFAAARAGDSSTVVRLFDQFSLDVNSPEQVSKSKNNTILHAACHCGDESLVLFLLDKGAKTDAMNDAKMYPFHIAISCGNPAAVRLLLQRRLNGKTLPGCHPSKAAPDGRTPLEMAIEGGNAELVKLLTKEATVHDVERCWGLPAAAPFHPILTGKKGFIDPETKKIIKEAAEKEREEAQKIADAERARVAEEKAQAKRERNQRRAEERLARQHEQALLEAKQREDELARKKAAAKAEAEETAGRLKAEKMARDQAEAEAAAHAHAEALRKAASAKAEAQLLRKAEEEKRRREQEAQAEAERQRKAEIAKAEEERRRKAKEEDRRREKEAQAEAERQRKAELAKAEEERRRKAKEEDRRRGKEAQAEAERQRKAEMANAEEERRREAKRAETLRRLQAQAEEHRRMAEAKLSQSVTVTKPTRVQGASQIDSQELERRANQSAKDKARKQASCHSVVLPQETRRTTAARGAMDTQWGVVEDVQTCEIPLDLFGY